MKIIAVYGVNNSGKTCAIKRFIDAISKQNEFVIERKVSLNQEDVLCTAVHKGKTRIGIVSRGDTREDLENAFREFDHCDVMICACRTKGGSEKTLEKKAKEDNDYLLWIGKSRISLWKGDKTQKGITAMQDQAVDFIAEMIYSAFLHLLEL